VSDERVSFERDVKQLFRERDRGAMMFQFDLWSYDSILKVVEEGAMPCDSQWDADQVETFRRWAEGGKGA
jgi:ABC-type histidine transport system ATPase subunit